MSRNWWAEKWDAIIAPRSSEEARRRLSDRVHPAADDFTGGDERVHVPTGREITVSNRAGVRKIVPEDY